MFHGPKKDPVIDTSEPLPEPEAPVPDMYPDKYASAPLFVKVEKYRELLGDVQEMKVFIAGVKQLFVVLNDVETVRSDALKILRASIQRLEKSVIEMDSELLRPKGFEMEVEGEGELRHIEDSLADLQKQLATLKRELQEMH